jgi:hypothetical protein
MGFLMALRLPFVLSAAMVTAVRIKEEKITEHIASQVLSESKSPGREMPACFSNCKSCGSPGFCGVVPNVANDHMSILTKNGACSPYNRLPDVQAPACRNPVPEVASDSDPPMIWQSPGADNLFIFHGCDGSGIQTDCMGDILYMEQFGVGGAIPHTFNVSPYPNHSPSNFVHPGNPPVTFPYYNCGWWNGMSRQPGQTGNGDLKTARWLLGVQGDAMYDTFDHLLRNCYDMNGNLCGSNGKSPKPLAADGLWSNAFWGDQENGKPPDQLLVGTISPWVCSEDSRDVMEEYTGHKNLNCYCDNEPWTGRQDDPNMAQPNWNTVLYYCALYSDRLKCQTYVLKPQDATAPHTEWQSNSDVHGHVQEWGVPFWLDSQSASLSRLGRLGRLASSRLSRLGRLAFKHLSG